MQLARSSMSRRYVYQPRMTARQLSEAMRGFDMTTGQLSRISGANIDRVNRWLKGEDDIPVYVQRDFYVWERDEVALDWAIQWADQHAQDVRSAERGPIA